MGVSAAARRVDVTKTFASESMASAPTTGTLTDDAVWNAGGFLRLNPAVSSKKGNIYWVANLPPVFTATADMAHTNTSGADSSWFFFGCSVNAVLEVGTTGYGYVIERNEFANSIRIRYGGSLLASVGYTDDTNFDTFQVDYVHGKFTITYKGSVVLTYTDTVNRTFPGSRFGWGARSGGTTNNHDVKNLSVVGRYGV